VAVLVLVQTALAGSVLLEQRIKEQVEATAQLLVEVSTLLVAVVELGLLAQMPVLQMVVMVALDSRQALQVVPLQEAVVEVGMPQILELLAVRLLAVALVMTRLVQMEL
jgi:hypothetical protein